MNKKLTSALLALVMIISLLAAAGPVYSKSSEPAITISVVPDKTEAQPGDTISYQVILGPVNNWADCEFTFVIPEGLTYVSATVSDEVAERFQGGWTESTKRFVIYGGKYTSDSDTLLLTVTCTVEESAAGSNLKVYLNDPFFCDRTGEDYVINGYDEGVSLDFDSGNSVTVSAPHSHVYDQQVATDTYKASGADCTNAATYYYSCKCGEKGSDTFSYGDPLGHTAGGDWQKNATHHWKVCQNAGCGVVVEETKVAHTPDREGGATEEYGIYCSVCGYELEAQLEHSHVFDQEVATEAYKASGADCTNAATYYFSCKCGEKGSDTFSYGDPLGHTAGGDWQKNATHHWKVCVNAGCGVVVEETKVAHTPDREGGATEEYGIYCSVCGYELEAQLQHSHVFDQEVATEAYKASGADCTNAATYYFSCKCGEKGRETFAYGDPLGHHECNDWLKDDDNHWKICQNENCGVIIDDTVEAHMDENEDGYCDVCNCSMGANIPETGDYDMMLFVLLIVGSLTAVALLVVKKKTIV